MGAQTFIHFANGKNAAEAFGFARREAQYDHGHAGYTGTIAEKHDFIMIELPPEKRHQKAADIDRIAARDFAEELLNKDDPRVCDKWGPAGCVALGGGSFLFFGWASS